MAVPTDYITIHGYPKVLTNADWQKKKSFLDKAKKATKTGLGAELVRAEAAYKKIKWDLLDAKMQGKWRDGDAIREGKRRAQQHYTAFVKPAEAIFMQASRKARDTATNPALSKTAQKAAAAISAELLRHVSYWKRIKFDDFDEALNRWQQGIDLWRGRLKGNVQTLERLLNALDRDPKLANWDNELTQAFRSVGNSLGNNPEFKDIWPTWRPWDGLQKDKFNAKTPEAEAQAIKRHIAEVRPHLNRLKQRVGA